MVTLVRTNSEHTDFAMLVKLLDADLAIRDGAEHAFYSQFNRIDQIRCVVLAYEAGQAIGCGAFKRFSEEAAEIKRMFVLPEARSKGIATVVLTELERWASELSYRRCILETGLKQPEAIRLYRKNGYRSTENYGQYAGVANSICFEKIVLP